jgi:hypothetical protein
MPELEIEGTLKTLQKSEIWNMPFQLVHSKKIAVMGSRKETIKADGFTLLLDVFQLVAIS